MDTDSSDPTTPDPATPDASGVPSPDATKEPVTATGERSDTIEEDEGGGVLPIPEPTADGAPAP